MWSSQQPVSPVSLTHSETMSTISSNSDSPLQNLLKVKIKQSNKQDCRIQEMIKPQLGYTGDQQSIIVKNVSSNYAVLKKKSTSSSAIDKLTKFEKKYSKIDNKNKNLRDEPENEIIFQNKVADVPTSRFSYLPTTVSQSPQSKDRFSKLKSLCKNRSNSGEPVKLGPRPSPWKTMENDKLENSTTNVKLAKDAIDIHTLSSSFLNESISNEKESSDILSTENQSKHLYCGSTNKSYNNQYPTSITGTKQIKISELDIKESFISTDSSVEIAEEMSIANNSINSITNVLSNIHLVSISETNKDPNKCIELKLDKKVEKFNSRSSTSIPEECLSDTLQFTNRSRNQSAKVSHQNVESYFKDDSIVEDIQGVNSSVEEISRFKKSHLNNETITKSVLKPVKKSTTGLSNVNISNEYKDSRFSESKLSKRQLRKGTESTSLFSEPFLRSNSPNNKNRNYSVLPSYSNYEVNTQDYGHSLNKKILLPKEIEFDSDSVTRNEQQSINSPIGENIHGSESSDTTIKPFSFSQFNIKSMEDLYLEEKETEKSNAAFSHEIPPIPIVLEVTQKQSEDDNEKVNTEYIENYIFQDSVDPCSKYEIESDFDTSISDINISDDLKIKKQSVTKQKICRDEKLNLDQSDDDMTLEIEEEIDEVIFESIGSTVTTKKSSRIDSVQADIPKSIISDLVIDKQNTSTGTSESDKHKMLKSDKSSENQASLLNCLTPTEESISKGIEDKELSVITDVEARTMFYNVGVQTEAKLSTSASKSSVQSNTSKMETSDSYTSPILKAVKLSPKLRKGTSSPLLTPYPLLQYYQTPEVMEAMASQQPMEIALHEVLKQQIHMTKYFMETQYSMYKAYSTSVKNLTKNYKPITLAETKKLIKKHRKSRMKSEIIDQ